MPDWTLYDWMIFLQLKCKLDVHGWGSWPQKIINVYFFCKGGGRENFQISPLLIFYSKSQGDKVLDVQRYHHPYPLWILLKVCQGTSFVFSLWTGESWLILVQKCVLALDKAFPKPRNVRVCGWASHLPEMLKQAFLPCPVLSLWHSRVVLRSQRVPEREELELDRFWAAGFLLNVFSRRASWDALQTIDFRNLQKQYGLYIRQENKRIPISRYPLCSHLISLCARLSPHTYSLELGTSEMKDMKLSGWSQKMSLSLSGNLEKWFPDSFGGRHLQIGGTGWVLWAKAREGGLILCICLSKCTGREPSRDISQETATTCQDLCSGGTLPAIFRIQRDWVPGD